MKLSEILSEQYYSNPRKDSHKWHKSMAFDKQVGIVRQFLRKYPVKSVISAYQSALQQRQFHPEDIKDIRQVMAKYNWGETI